MRFKLDGSIAVRPKDIRAKRGPSLGFLARPPGVSPAAGKDDELVEVTPGAIRLCKRYLDLYGRKRAERRTETAAA